MRSDEPIVAQTVLDSVADGVFTVDREWRITSFNRAAERITGVHRGEAIGARCCDVFRASICGSECALQYSMDTGESIVNKAIMILDSKARKVPVRISTAVLRDQKGQVVGGVETIRDLSQVDGGGRERQHGSDPRRQWHR